MVDRTATIEAIRQSAIRQVDEEFGRTERKLGDLVSRFAMARTLGSSGFVVTVQQTLLDELRRICRVVMEIFAINAPTADSDFVEVLRQVLTTLLNKVEEAYDARVQGPRYAQTASLTPSRASFLEEGRQIVAGFVADFGAGIVHSRAAPLGVNIGMATAPVAIVQNSPAAQTQAGSHQVQLGVDRDSLLEALADLKSKVAAEPLDENEKFRVIDDVISLEHELRQERPEPSRLRRLAAAPGKRTADLAFSVMTSAAVHEVLRRLS